MHVRIRTSSIRKVFTIDVVTLILFTAFNIYIENAHSIVKLAPFYQYFLYLLAAGIVVYMGTNWMLIYSPDSRSLWWLKYGIILLIILITIIVPAIFFILIRHQNESYFYSNDGLVQSELAVRFVLNGENPYTADYSKTPMALWPFRIGNITENPALTHYAYLPLTFLLPLPFQLAAENVWGWFDQRILFLFLFLIMFVTIPLLSNSKMIRALLLITFGLTPFFAMRVAEGGNDILVLFWIVLSITALKIKRIYFSAFFLALACSTKHFAWMLVPFYFLYLGGEGQLKERIDKVKKPFFLFVGVTGLILLPWLIQDPLAFYEDVFAYISGILPDGYPINGLGFSVWLLRLGVLKTRTDTFPFRILQIAFTLPILILLLRKQIKDNTLNRAMLNYGISLGVLLFFSVAFNNNYLGYLFVIFSLAMLIDTGTSSEAGNAVVTHSSINE